MRIVFTSITDTGILRSKIELIEELIKFNEIYIVSPEKNGKNELQDMGCKIINIEINSHGKNPLSDFMIYKKYIKIYKEIKPEIVLAYTIKPNIYSGLACQKLKIPYLATINGIGDSLFNKSIVQQLVIKLLKFSLKKAKCIFFQNENNYNFFKNNKIIKKQKIIMVPGSGINLEKHKIEDYPESNDLIKIVNIGRITKDKGANEFFAMVDAICKKHKNIKFYVVGNCNKEFKEKLQKSIEKGYVEYYGTIPYDHIHNVIKKCHAVLLPSYHEGIANVLLEGAACGRPIIATSVEGCKETFENNITGIGCEPQNANSLIQAVEKFIDLSNENMKEMGILGRKKIEKEFDRKIVIKKYINEIEKEGKINVTL